MRKCSALYPPPKATFGIARSNNALPLLHGRPSFAPTSSNNRSSCTFLTRACHRQRCTIHSFHKNNVWLHVVACARLPHVCLASNGAAKETCGGGEFGVFKPSEVVTHQLGGAHAKQLGQDASPSFASAAQQERRRASVQGSLRQRDGTSASVEACAGRQTSPSTRTGWNRQVQICFWWLHVS